MPIRLPIRLAHAFGKARHLAVALAVTPSVAAAGPTSDSSATQVQSSTEVQSSTPVRSTEWRGLLCASAVGSSYDWLSFEPGDSLLQSRPDGIRSLTFMSEFSPGPGFSIGLGGVGRHLLGPVSVSGAIDYLHVYHSTTFESGSNETDLNASATLQALRFQLRAIWDDWQLKPFLAVAPGLTRFSLPDQELRWDSMSEEPVMVVDAWTSGLSLATLLGVLYELRPNLLLNTNVGHHIEIFDRTNELELDPESIVAHGFTVALGFEWWP